MYGKIAQTTAALAVGLWGLAAWGGEAKTVAAGETFTVTDENAGDYASFTVEGATADLPAGVLNFNTSAMPAASLAGAGEVRKTSSALWTCNGSTTAQTGFTGRYVLMAGEVRMGDGTPNRLFGSTSATCVVTNGATLSFNAASLAFDVPLRLSGRGAKDADGADLGAVRVMKTDGDLTGLKGFTLDEDALLVVATGYIFNGSSGKIDLNGHDLHKSGKGIVYSYSGSVTGKGRVILETGTSASARTDWNLRESYSFGQTTDDPLVLMGNTEFNFQNDAILNRPVRVEGLGNYFENENQYGDKLTSYKTDWVEDVRTANGPIEICEGGQLVTGGVGQYRSMTLAGCISGKGELRMAKNEYSGRLNVTNPTNAFEGTVYLDGTAGGSVHLAYTNALPKYAAVTGNAVRVALRATDDDATWPAAAMKKFISEAVLTNGSVVAIDPDRTATKSYEIDNAVADWFGTADATLGIGVDALDAASTLTVKGPVRGGRAGGAWTGTLRYTGEAPIEVGRHVIGATAKNAGGLILLDGAKDVAITRTNDWSFLVGSKRGGTLRVTNSTLRLVAPELHGLSGDSFVGRGSIAVGEGTDHVGTFEVEAGSVVTTRLCVAHGSCSRGTVKVRGGRLTVIGGWDDGGNYGPTYVGYGSGAHGVVEMSGGVFESRGAWFIGTYGPGLVIQRGGTLVHTNHIAHLDHISSFMNLGNGSVPAVYYVSNAVSRIGGYLLMNRGGATSQLTLDAGAEMFVSQHIAGGYADNVANTQQVNLNGGILHSDFFSMRYTPAEYKVEPRFWINFNGGTFRLKANAKIFVGSNSATRLLDRVTVFARGATIDVPEYTSCTTGLPMEKPFGGSVLGVPLPAELPTGFDVLPAVVFEGDGEGASAIALFDAATKTVTGIHVTCPGWGYTHATAKLRVGSSYYATNYVCTVGAEQPGGLTKKGLGTLTLDATNTWSGATRVAGGTLKQGVTNALPPQTDVVLTGGGVLDLAQLPATLGSVTYGVGAGSIVNADEATVPTAFTVEISAAELAAGARVAFAADKDLAQATVKVTGDVASLCAGTATKYVLATGAFTGTPAAYAPTAAELPPGWRYVAGPGMVKLAHSTGSALILR